MLHIGDLDGGSTVLALPFTLDLCIIELLEFPACKLPQWILGVEFRVSEYVYHKFIVDLRTLGYQRTGLALHAFERTRFEAFDAVKSCEEIFAHMKPHETLIFFLVCCS